MRKMHTQFYLLTVDERDLFCDLGVNIPSGLIHCRECLDQLSSSQHLKEDTTL